MTTDELGLELTGQSPPGGDRATAAGRDPSTVTQVMNVCDRILGEPARRNHLFAWLRAPGAAADEWLPVDGYYPGNKLVVVWHASPAPSDHVYSELVPAHGFRLLELTPDDLGGDQASAADRLRARIDALGPAPRRAREAQARESTMTRAVWSLAPTRPETGPAAPSPDAAPSQGAVPTRHEDDGATASVPPRPSVEVRPLGAGFGALLGVVLTAALVAEVYLGVVFLGFDHGQPLLALALTLDTAARTLGTMAAAHAGLADWAWRCALGGSPLVAMFVTFVRREAVAAEPAPLAGVISLLAMGIAALGGLVALATISQ
jgi:hypothetical protein